MVKNDTSVMNYWKYLKCIHDYENRLKQLKNQSKRKFMYDNSQNSENKNHNLISVHQSILNSAWEGI